MVEKLLWLGDGREIAGTCPDLGSLHQVAIVTLSQECSTVERGGIMGAMVGNPMRQWSKGRFSFLLFQFFPSRT